MVHKPKHKVHSFKGLLGDGGQDEIQLERQSLNVAYRIVKFQIIGAEPGQQHMEHTVKIYRAEQSTINNAINFADSSLLGVAYIQDSAGETYPSSTEVIFDTEVFNQDIYVTHEDTVGSQPCNYYLELEVIPLDDAGAEYTTLKDMRQS